MSAAARSLVVRAIPAALVACAAYSLMCTVPTLAADARVKVVDYDPHGVLALTAFVGYHVHFEFEPDEHFVNLGAGDTSAIDVGAEANHLLIKPRAPNGGTNLTIITNKRAYYVEYRALARIPHGEEATYSVSFRYALPAQVQTERPEVVRSGTRLDARPPTPNLNYWYCGSPKLRPVAAADDGLQLQLTFAADAELPAIYALAADGTEALVNSHSERDTVFVHRIAPRLVLRRGREVGCVVDRSERGATRRAASGTIDSGTERVLNAGEP
jgi:type IV secretion system protein VirB9